MKTSVIFVQLIFVNLAKSYEYFDLLPYEECVEEYGEQYSKIWKGPEAWCCRRSYLFDCYYLRTDTNRTTPAYLALRPDRAEQVKCFWFDGYHTGEKCPNFGVDIAWSNLRDPDGKERAFCCENTQVYFLTKMSCHWNWREQNMNFKCKPGFVEWFKYQTNTYLDETVVTGMPLPLRFWDILCCQFEAKYKFENGKKEPKRQVTRPPTTTVRPEDVEYI